MPKPPRLSKKALSKKALSKKALSKKAPGKKTSTRTASRPPNQEAILWRHPLWRPVMCEAGARPSTSRWTSIQPGLTSR